MTDHTDSDRPILFAYDGSEQAQEAIREAARQLRPGRHAIVLSVWQLLASLPFAGAMGAPPDLEAGIEREALKQAGEGAALARSLGFEARPMTTTAEPVWSGIVNAADEHDASLIVMGSHGRTGAALVVMGSVASAVTRHTDRPVLVVHSPPFAAAA